MKKPTQKQIDAEIQWLKTNRKNVRRESVFGDNHWDSIEAQISVLENAWTEDDVYVRYPLEDSQIVEDGEAEAVAENVHNSATEAAQWLVGEEKTAPSKNWESLIQK